MKSPILFLIFSRPDTTKQVFEAIRQARPPRLYVAADGPRSNREGERERCEITREIATRVDWPCELKTLFRNDNLGCGNAVSKAITWFFENEEEGIILEDDVLPHPDFFSFCDEMLEKYRNDNRVGIISGHNHLYDGITRTESYGFMPIINIWGWATWRRNWKIYDFNLKNSTIGDYSLALKKFYSDCSICNSFKWTYRCMKEYLVDTWDYQFSIALTLNEKINITPYKNLTKNIGFGENASHTTNDNQKEMGIEMSGILPIVHPDKVEVDAEATSLEIENIHRKLSTWKYYALIIGGYVYKYTVRLLKK
jgi:hypothetical protein